MPPAVLLLAGHGCRHCPTHSALSQLPSFDLTTANNLLVQILNFENKIINKLDRITSAIQQPQLCQLLPLLLSSALLPAYWKNLNSAPLLHIPIVLSNKLLTFFKLKFCTYLMEKKLPYFCMYLLCRRRLAFA